MAATAIESIKQNIAGIAENEETEKNDVAALKARLLAVETTVENLVKVVNNQLDVTIKAGIKPDDSNPPSPVEGPGT